ncbi:PLAC8-domain-containing protein, partial [Roridomyces roridus]
QPTPTAGMRISGGNRNALDKPFDNNDQRAWSHDLCSCFGDCGSFCYALWCPSVVHGKNRQRLRHLMDEGTPAQEDEIKGCSGACWSHWALNLVGMGCILAARARYGIRGSALGDCTAALCCHSLDLNQVSREIELEERSFGKPRLDEY